MTNRDAAIEAACRAFITSKGRNPDWKFPGTEVTQAQCVNQHIRAAIAAYEQERAKDEAVGVIVRFIRGSDQRPVKRFYFAEDGNFTVEENWSVTPVYLHPSPAADVKAKRAEVMSAVQNLRRYRAFVLTHVWPPIPIRTCDWQAAHVDYDGPEDNRIFHAATREELIALIDEWHENQPCDRCDGRGSNDFLKIGPCALCGGSGYAALATSGGGE